MNINSVHSAEGVPFYRAQHYGLSLDALPAVQPLPFAVVLEQTSRRGRTGEAMATNYPLVGEIDGRGESPEPATAALSALLWRRPI